MKTIIITLNNCPSDCRGTEDVLAPHGIPLDLLDRLLTVKTMSYSRSEMEQILRLRAHTEGLEMEDEALTALGANTNKHIQHYG